MELCHTLGGAYETIKTIYATFHGDFSLDCP